MAIGRRPRRRSFHPRRRRRVLAPITLVRISNIMIFRVKIFKVPISRGRTFKAPFSITPT
jgi:hypothetical protein